MKVCILGNGLTSLTLAKTLANLGIYVDIITCNYPNNINTTRTLGISQSNLEFYNKKITNIKKFLWGIRRIEIFSENLKNEKILNFENNNQNLFSLIKNHELIDHLLVEISKSKLINLKKKKIDENIIKKNYNLIINCDYSNILTKKFFYKYLHKDYKSHAYTSIIHHKKINNDTAIQIFTSIGPLAFLPVSSTETSVVYSVKKKSKIDFNLLLKRYNFKYEISKINDVSYFPLKSFNLRNYYYKNILAFGDLLHKIHPLAGQGFNMSLRDIKEIYYLIKYRIDNGLELDSSVCKDFETKTKHTNFLFLNGIDLVYEFFNFENKMNNNILSKSIKFFGKKRIINNFLTKVADKGIII